MGPRTAEILFAIGHITQPIFALRMGKEAFGVARASRGNGGCRPMSFGEFDEGGCLIAACLIIFAHSMKDTGPPL